MVKYPCPHCGALTISGLRKAFLGPGSHTTCSECGKKVSVPVGRSLLASIPWFLALGMMSFIQENCLISFWVGSLGAMGMLVAWMSFVPLKKV